MNKEIKKTAIEKEKEREQERLLSILPMRKHFLKEYFDFLDKFIEEERKPSLKLTEQFCKNNGLDFEKVKTWAAEFGSFNDQEILWNIEELYEVHMKE
jgi:CMP-N-acetylneuraminic acid synthetase